MAKVSANQIQPVYSHWEGLTDEQFMLSMTDFEEYCRNSIIYDKNGHPVTFELNEAQRLTADTILKAIEPILTKKPTPSIRVCIHKSRQMGITTLCLKLEQYIMSKVTHFNTIHIMPTEPEADELRDRKLMPMLQATHPDLMPVMISSGNHIDFKEFEGNLLDNRLTYGSAGAKGGYHGRMSPVDTPIITPGGWKKMGELRVGDRVFGRDGSPAKVIGVYPQGKKQNYTVKMRNGSRLEAGSEHRWLIKKKHSSPFAVVDTAELQHRLERGLTCLLPLSSPIEFPQKEVPLDPYLLGVLIGDAWLGSKSNRRVSLSTREPEFLKLGDSYAKDRGIYSVNFGVSVFNALEKLGLSRKKSAEKLIPDAYLHNSVEVRRKLLAGLLDTDGYYNRTSRQIEYSTVSKRLAYNIKELVFSLGGKATITKRDTPGFRGEGFTGNMSYRVMIRTDFNPFSLERHRSRWVKPREFRYTEVESITPSRKVESVCIAVDNEDHTYISGEDFVVSHNTIHCLVEDEHSKYIDPFTLEAGLLPAMSGNTIRIVLFTAKGMNHSYDLSKTAQDPESDWVYLFLPWYILSEYEMAPVGKYESLRGLSDYDIFLFEEFKRAGVPKNKWQAKAMWYNYTFINEAKRDTKYMYENYPTIAEESFKASGSPIFDANKIREWEKQPYKKLDVFYREGKTVFEYTDDGVIREKEPPRRGQTYIIGADPADGEVAGDDSALVVFKLTDDKISAVCSYNGSISQNDFAELLYDVAMRYNEALIVPERNTGQLMIKWLTEIKGYFNIWTDASKVSNYNNLGVYTTVATKNEAIGRIKFLINNGHYEDFDPRFCEQAKYFTYERTPSGQLRAAAAGGHHDDTVMCRVIAMMALDMERFGNYNEMAIKDGRKY